ncbi:unnamed protein product [Mytilus coruscus]|uniref:Endonuclease/exonuclease/phosphatase domain-containing protein n=1 Tax=Mytilus coruscus TaxID=42192 RepID=A0A6J8DJ63_MYTCO|nr:unnamed protein product [Mytilus coruscus]
MSTIPSIDSSFSPSVFSSPKPRLLSSTTEESTSRASKPISGLEQKQQNLRILMINCQSIRNKRSELNESVECMFIKLDVIIGCESWLANEHRTAEIFPNGYNKNVFRKDRNKNGGGVFIAVYDKFTTSAVDNSENDCELQWADIQTKTKSIIIGSYYRPPNASVDALYNLKTSVLNVSENSKDKPIILAGDFNLSHIDWDNNTVKSGKAQVKHHQELLELIEEFGMEQLQLKASRENNILDLFLTNHPSLVKSCNTLPGISDHNMIVLDTDLKLQYNKPKPREIYVYKKAKWEEIKADIIKLGSDITNSNTAVEDKWTNLKKEQVTENPYLCVIISDNLKCSSHINKFCNKANSTLGFIKRNLKHCNKHFKETAYISLVRSVLDYSGTVWDPFLQKDINRIESIQRRAARFVCKDYRRTSSVTSVMKDLGWKPLVKDREQRLVLLYKIVNDLVAIPTEHHIEFNTRPSRTSNVKQLKLYQQMLTFINILFFHKLLLIGTYCQILQ